MKTKFKRNILINCRYCGKKIFKYGLPSYHVRKFCSLSCSSKFLNRKRTIKAIKKVKCRYCGKEFMRLKSNIKNKIYCNKECYLKDKTRIKKGKGAYGKALFFKCNYCGKKVAKFISACRTKYYYCNKECYLKAVYAKVELKCDNCNKKYLYNKKMSIGYKFHFCSIKCKRMYFKNNPVILGDNNPAKRPEVREKIRKAKLGVPRFNMRREKNPNWLGGKSFEPYTYEFNGKLKEKIRKKDNHKCQLCGVPQLECIRKLDVHHIDYDKKNSDPVNLTTLCNGCNIRVNYNRDYWEKYFKRKIKEKLNVLAS